MRSRTAPSAGTTVSTWPLLLRAEADWNVLHGVDVGRRQAVIARRPQLGLAGIGQIALRLEDEERRGEPGVELAVLGIEPPFGKRNGQARRVDALPIGLRLANHGGHLGAHLELGVGEAELV